MAYVAYTRAENALFLSDAEGTNYDGSFRYPSRFIFNTDKAYLNYTVELEERLVVDSAKYIEVTEGRFSAPQTEFQVGDTVEHRIFGIGRIVEIKPELTSYVIRFEKMETERNISFKAPIKKVENS